MISEIVSPQNGRFWLKVNEKEILWVKKIVNFYAEYCWKSLEILVVKLTPVSDWIVCCIFLVIKILLLKLFRHFLFSKKQCKDIHENNSSVMCTGHSNPR
jgi:hypothetical protein